MKRYRVKGVRIYENTLIRGFEHIVFGENIIIDSFVHIYAKKKITIGNYVSIGNFVFLSGGEEISIGDFSGLAQGSKIFASTDDFKNWGFGNPTIDEKYRNPTRKPVRIERFCVIGANSVTLPGVTIGEGATVGACSVVTRDLEPWGIYIGNRRIGERDRDGVLRNYEKFLSEQETQKREGRAFGLFRR